MMGNQPLWHAMTQKEALLASAEQHSTPTATPSSRTSSFTTTATRSRRAPARSSRGSAFPPRPIASRCRPSPAASSCACCSPRCWPRPRRPAARRADQPPRHPLDPLAREVPRRLRGLRGRHLARPALPRQRLHAHPRRRLRDDHALHRQLRPVRRGQAGEPRAQGARDREAREGDRRQEAVRRALRGQGHQGAPGAVEAEADREDRDREAAPDLAPLPDVPVPAQAPERPRGARAARGLRKPTARRRCSRTSRSPCSAASGWRSSGPTASASRRCSRS